MKTRDGAEPPSSGVRRHFEGNRLAKDSQARAYDAVLADRSVNGAAASAQVSPEQIVTKGGMAA
jgi:hypothetical protein